MSIQIDFNEVNKLIYDYLVLNGLNNSAFSLKYEAGIKDTTINKISLLYYLEKGLIYNKLETHMNNTNNNCLLESNKELSCEEIKDNSNDFIYWHLKNNEKIVRNNFDKIIIENKDSYIIKSYKNKNINITINKDFNLRDIEIYNDLAILMYENQYLKIINIIENKIENKINFDENILLLEIKNIYMLVYLQTYYCVYIYDKSRYYFKFKLKMHNIQFEFLDYPRIFILEKTNNKYFIFNHETGNKIRLYANSKTKYNFKISENKKIFCLYNKNEINIFLDKSEHFLKITAKKKIEDISFEYDSCINSNDSNILIVFENSNIIYFYSLITGKLISNFKLKCIKDYYFKCLINRNLLFFDANKIYIFYLTNDFFLKNLDSKIILYKDFIIVDGNNITFLNKNNYLENLLINY